MLNTCAIGLSARPEQCLNATHSSKCEIPDPTKREHIEKPLSLVWPIVAVRLGLAVSG